jgi:hypothetical protein
MASSLKLMEPVSFPLPDVLLSIFGMNHMMTRNQWPTYKFLAKRMSESQLTECALHQDAQHYSHHGTFSESKLSETEEQIHAHRTKKPSGNSWQSFLEYNRSPLPLVRTLTRQVNPQISTFKLSDNISGYHCFSGLALFPPSSFSLHILSCSDFLPSFCLPCPRSDHLSNWPKSSVHSNHLRPDPGSI